MCRRHVTKARANMPQCKRLKQSAFGRFMSPMVLRRICAILLAAALSVAGFGLVASHGVLRVAASDAARPDAIMSMAAPDCHGHATAPDDRPTPAQSKDFHVCSDMCCVILATALPPVTPFVAPPPVLAEAMIQPETLRRAPPAPPPRT